MLAVIYPNPVSCVRRRNSVPDRKVNLSVPGKNDKRCHDNDHIIRRLFNVQLADFTYNSWFFVAF